MSFLGDTVSKTVFISQRTFPWESLDHTLMVLGLDHHELLARTHAAKPTWVFISLLGQMLCTLLVIQHCELERAQTSHC